MRIRGGVVNDGSTKSEDMIERAGALRPIKPGRLAADTVCGHSTDLVHAGVVGTIPENWYQIASERPY